MIINELLNESPQIGDSIDLELGNTLIETIIEDITEDGIVIKLDETAMKLMLQAKQELNESRAGLKFAKALGREREKIDREHKAGEEQRAKNKKEVEDKKNKAVAKEDVTEAEYQGRKVSLGKPFLTPDGPKKRSVYVKNSKRNVVKVNFGQKGVKIKKNNPARRKSFRARHNCSTAKDRTTARYWSCRFW